MVHDEAVPLPPTDLVSLACLCLAGVTAALGLGFLWELRESERLSAEVLSLRRPDDLPPGIDLEGTRGLDGLPGWVRGVVAESLPEQYVDFQVLGEGGMGVVLAAHDRHLDRRVAVKVPPPHISCRPRYRARFLREARAMARLEHENVARIFDVPEVAEGAVPVMVLELLEGEDLEATWKARGPIELGEVAGWIEQAAAGLQAAHDQGVLHRDVKPANLFREASGRVKVLDFGLAAVEGARVLTATGARFGTYAYMPPEQMHGQRLDPRADQYSLAVSAYFLASSRLPFDLTDQFRMNPEAFSRVLPGAPPALDAVFQRALSGFQDERYPTVRAFAQALQAALG